jgi:hypothetical protein
MPATRAYRMAIYGLAEKPAVVQLNGEVAIEVQPGDGATGAMATWDVAKNVLYYTFSY